MGTYEGGGGSSGKCRDRSWTHRQVQGGPVGWYTGHRMIAWRVLLPLLAAALSMTGCKRGRASAAADPPALDLHEGSELVVEADDVVHAFATGSFSDIYSRMTPSLRERIRVADLELAAKHLAEEFGPARGVMEEKVHREGDLVWFSGLVVHALPADPAAEAGTPEARGILTPILYQFALTDDRRYARLLVREHWFWSAVEHPADYYVPVNRFFVPGRGNWTVSHGGRTRATNKHHGSRSQRFAFDLVVKRDGRARPRSASKRNESYYCYGQPLLAPASGTVVEKKDGVPENAVGERGKGGGNGIRIDHGFGESSSLWHMVPGSVRVEEGDHVEAGEVVGLVGNSGRSSGPHIHFDVFHPGPKFGLPVEFVDTFVDERWRDRGMPVRGEVIRSWPAKDKSSKRTASAPTTFIAG